MKDMPGMPSQADLDYLAKRAKLLGNRCGCPGMQPQPTTPKRSDLRSTQDNAYGILRLTHDGACAKLARDVVNLAHSFDNLWMEIFPVFEMIDEKIHRQKCTLEYGEFGYELKTPGGKILSSGATMREWLINHVSLYGDQITCPYEQGVE